MFKSPFFVVFSVLRHPVPSQPPHVQMLQRLTKVTHQRPWDAAAQLTMWTMFHAYLFAWRPVNNPNYSPKLIIAE